MPTKSTDARGPRGARPQSAQVPGGERPASAPPAAPEDAPKKLSGAAFRKLRRQRQAEDAAAGPGPAREEVPGTTLHAGAAWTLRLVLDELRGVANDPSLTPAQRRREVAALARLVVPLREACPRDRRYAKRVLEPDEVDDEWPST